jgi:K+/H+ antiporter YhaU regulatory subunit KhtT
MCAAREKSNSPVYFQIARDIAKRIAAGDFTVGERISGRSVMSSEYGVSPETIRRAFHLLEDNNVIEVRPQSGAYVLSAESAKLYLSQTADTVSGRELQDRLNSLISEQMRVSKELTEVTAIIAKKQVLLFSAAEQGFGLGEVTIREGSWVIGKTIGKLAFWQATGATVVAIRRAGEMIISPGPYADLRIGDCLIYVLNKDAEGSVEEFINRPCADKE